jgi:energy-coupling factor transporter transmembrane protein EcfT
MANVLYTLSLQRRSFIGAFHPLSILSVVGGVVVIVFSTLSTWVYFGLLLFLLAVMVVDRIPLKQVGKMVLVILPLCFFITLIQILAQSKDPFYAVEILGKTITFSSYGLELGLRISARVFLLALPLSLFFMIVSPMRFTRALYDAGIPF